jgi:hypothetical protein
MNHRAIKSLLPVAIILMLSAVGVGCGGKKIEPVQPPPSNFENTLKSAPRWVTLERDPDDKSGKNIYAVGVYGGTRDLGLARDAALENARVRVASNLRTQVKALAEGYAANVQKTRGSQDVNNGQVDDNSQVASDDERKFVNGFVNGVNMFVSGIETVDTWADSNNRLFILVRLNIDKFRQTAQQMSSLDSEMKKAIDERAEAFWDKINNAK